MAEKPKFYVSERVLAELGEQMLVAARRLTDELGLLVRAPLPMSPGGSPFHYDEAKIFEVARNAIAEITGCEIVKRDATDG